MPAQVPDNWWNTEIWVNRILLLNSWQWIPFFNREWTNQNKAWIAGVGARRKYAHTMWWGYHHGCYWEKSRMDLTMDAVVHGAGFYHFFFWSHQQSNFHETMLPCLLLDHMLLAVVMWWSYHHHQEMRGQPTWSVADTGEILENMYTVMYKRRHNTPEDASPWKFNCHKLQLNLYLPLDK